MKIFWCKNCLNMSTRPRITFDKRGYCNACQWMEEKKILDWTKREKQLEAIINEAKKNKKGDFDCLVPVSGGKDGSYVAHQLKEKYGLNILTVTSKPPLESEIGKINLNNFKKKGFKHVHIKPDEKAMKKINKLGLIKKGSPYYGWLISIFSVVLKVAMQEKIDLSTIIPLTNLLSRHFLVQRYLKIIKLKTYEII